MSSREKGDTEYNAAASAATVVLITPPRAIQISLLQSSYDWRMYSLAGVVGRGPGRARRT